MNLFRNHILLYLFGMFFLLSSCSKEKNFERRLIKKGGTWEIQDISWRVIEQDFSPIDLSSVIGQEEEGGEFVFNYKKKGTYDYTIQDIRRLGSFNWDIDGQQLIITKVSHNIEEEEFDEYEQKIIEFEGEETSHNYIKLEGKETILGPDGQIVLEATIYMKR